MSPVADEVQASWDIQSGGESAGCLTVLAYPIQSITIPGTSEPGEADMTLYGLLPEYGMKVLTPPPPPEQLFWPTTWGPNAEGEIDGALLPPALVPDVVAEDGSVHSSTVAASKFTLSAGDIISSVSVGILPFKETAKETTTAKGDDSG